MCCGRCYGCLATIAATVTVRLFANFCGGVPVRMSRCFRLRGPELRNTRSRSQRLATAGRAGITIQNAPWRRPSSSTRPTYKPCTAETYGAINSSRERTSISVGSALLSRCRLVLQHIFPISSEGSSTLFVSCPYDLC